MRWCSRWASSTRPSFSKKPRRSANSALMLSAASLSRSRDVTKWVFGKIEMRSCLLTVFPVMGSKLDDVVHFVAEEADAQCQFVVGRMHLHDVAADTERAAPELQVVALVEDLDQLAQDVVA